MSGVCPALAQADREDCFGRLSFNQRFLVVRMRPALTGRDESSPQDSSRSPKGEYTSDVLPSSYATRSEDRRISRRYLEHLLERVGPTAERRVHARQPLDPDRRGSQLPVKRSFRPCSTRDLDADACPGLPHTPEDVGTR